MTNGSKTFNGPLALMVAVVVVGIGLTITPKLGLALGVATVSAWLLARWSRARGRRTAHQGAIDRACDLIDLLNRQRVFPPARTRVSLPQEEEVLLAATASLCEPRAIVHSDSPAAKSRPRSAPLRFDRSSGFAHVRLRTVDEGELVVSPQRLVFVGTRQTTDLRLNDLIKVEADADSLVLSRAGQTAQIVLRVPDPPVWRAVIGVAASVPLIGRTLPDDAQLRPPRRPLRRRTPTPIKRYPIGR